MTATKTCRICGKTLPLEAFHLDRKRPDNRRDWCKNCANAWNREYRAKRGLVAPGASA